MKAMEKISVLVRGAIGIALIGTMVSGWILFTAFALYEILGIVADLIGHNNNINEGK